MQKKNIIKMLVPAYVYDLFPLNQLRQLPPYGDKIIYSAIILHLVYNIGHLFSKHISHYQKLPPSKQASWCIHIVSFFFSFTVLIATIPIFGDQHLQNDRYFATSNYAQNVYAYASGYFLCIYTDRGFVYNNLAF